MYRSLFLRAAMAGALAFLAADASAAPVLTFQYTNSGQVVSTTSQVTIGGRITNTGDTALYASQSSFTFLIPQPAYNQYLWISGAFPKGPSVFIDLDPGESVDWTITILGTYPITGARGDPVPPGEYFLEPDSMKITYAVFDPILGPTSERYSISAAPGRFVWTVVDQTAGVAEPASILLLAGGLAAVARRRRRGGKA